MMSKEFAIQVVSQLVQAGYVAYWAGGCVRDLLRGEEPHDYDVATSATPNQVRQVFGARRSLAVGESFGVMIVLGPKASGDSVEVATFRREGDYLDGRRPSSVEFCTPEEDAGRRDFTINGMFYDPLKEVVHDFVGGQRDLQSRIVRAIGNPRARLEEDKLRMLRAVRFATRLNFELEQETAEAVREMATQVCIVSAERISQELRKMLVDESRARAMQLCRELGLLEMILPEVLQFPVDQSSEHWDRRLRLLTNLDEVNFPLVMAALLLDVRENGFRTGEPEGFAARSKKQGRDGSRLPGTDSGMDAVHRICRSLRFSNQETTDVCWLVSHFGQVATLPESSLATTKRLAVHPLFSDLLKLERVEAAIRGGDDRPFQWIDEFLSRTSRDEIDPPQFVTGQDLLALGIRSGPNFKTWLHQIRDAQLNLEIHSKAEAIELARQLSGQKDEGR